MKGIMNCTYCGCEYEAERISSQYCTARCRVAANRSVTEVSVTQTPLVTLKGDPDVTVGGVVRKETTLNTDLIGPDVYYWPRTNPERINWGEHMSMDQLKEAGLVANRVPIPGDWDYVGVHEEAA